MSHTQNTIIDEYQKELEEGAYEKECMKCGGELSAKMVGDETYDFCEDCKMVTH